MTSMPRPSTFLVSASSCSSAPSPQPTSSTREPAATISAISRWSTRCWRGAGGCQHQRRSGARFSPRFVGGRIEEAAHGREQLRLLQQEGVVALVGLDLDEADVGRHGVQRLHDLAALARRIEPVAGEGDHAEARLGALEGVGQHVAVLGGEVEVVDGAGDVEIAVGVEAVDEGGALVAQVALDLEVGVEARSSWPPGPAGCGRTCAAAPPRTGR